MEVKKIANLIISTAVDLFGSFDKCPENVKSMMLKKTSKKFGVKESDIIAEIATISVFGK